MNDKVGSSDVNESNSNGVKPSIPVISTEKNSLAAVLSKLQQIKTQGSLNISGCSTNAIGSDIDSGLNLVALSSTPPSQKISTSFEKSLYRFVFAVSNTEFTIFANLPHHLNPILLPDVPTLSSYTTADFDKNGRAIAMCRCCRTSFHRLDDRDRHLARKTIRIICPCSEKCLSGETMFFNKCTFYLHLVQERIKSSTSQPFDLSKAIVVNLKPEDNPIVSQEWYHALMEGAPSTESLLREKIKLILDSNEISTEQLPNDICPVCETTVSDVHAHLQAFVPLEDQNCSLCSRTSLINTCAFTAHQSIHIDASWHSCPECGLFVERNEDFNKHLKQCHHFNKISGFRCISCQLNFTKLSVMCDHVAKKHSEFFFKCSQCTLAFKSEPSVNTHYLNSHGIRVTKQYVEGLQHLYKCLICQELTIGDDAIRDHVAEQHVNLSRVRRFFYFRCPSCAKVYESKTELVNHISSLNDEGHKKWRSNEAICDVCHETFEKYIDMIAHRQALHADTLAKFCPTVPVQHDNGSHLDQIKGKLNAPFGRGTMDVLRNEASGPLGVVSQRLLVCPHPNCSKSGTQFLYTFQLELHTCMIHSPRECQFCPSTYHGSSSFEKHLLIDHGKGNVADAFECIVCQSKFDNSVIRNHHVTLFHGWGQTVGGGVSNSASFVPGSNSNFSLGNAAGNTITKLECKVCSISFDRLSYCKEHFALVHPSGFNFVCLNCPTNNTEAGDKRLDTSTGSERSKRNEYPIFDTLSEFKKHQASEHDFSYPKSAKVGRFAAASILDADSNDTSVAGKSSDLNEGDKQLFSCFKGDYSTTDRAEFTWHIQQHADKTHQWQCGECGFNMVQETGLKSHLLTQHNVIDYEEYKAAVMSKQVEVGPAAANNDDEKSNVVAGVEATDSFKSLCEANPLICSVCFIKFENVDKYKEHRDAGH